LPQSVSALAISPDGRQIAVTTLAFRHDRNFWVLANDGQVLWGRYLDPWAPAQVAFVPQGKRFAVGLAYSRFTDPHPTFALFEGETNAPSMGLRTLGIGRALRIGDWRTVDGQPADMLAATAGVFSPRRFISTRRHRGLVSRLNLGKRAWRMTTSADGRVPGADFTETASPKSKCGQP
jgi:hypothetical protein